MTKEQFVDRATEQIRFKILNAEKRAKNEIASQRERMDKPAFLEWVKNEQAAAGAVPALKMYDSAFGVNWDKVPGVVAQTLADLIELDIVAQRDPTGIVRLTGKVNWPEQWEQAGPVLMAGSLLPSEWKYYPVFIPYIDALKADVRTRTFKQVSYKKPKEERPYSIRLLAMYLFYTEPGATIKRREEFGAIWGFKGRSFVNEHGRITKLETRTNPSHIKDLDKAIQMMLENGADQEAQTAAKNDQLRAYNRAGRKK